MMAEMAATPETRLCYALCTEMGRVGRWGREGDTEEGGGHAAVGGQLGHWLLLEQEGQRMGRQGDRWQVQTEGDTGIY